MAPANYENQVIHRKMLRDRLRCETYRRAIAKVVRPGDVVLDMGAGTGILSIFAAQARACKVYAIERTAIADIARQLIEANGLADRIEVRQADMETVELPEQVDVIVSEWMGSFGVDENLLPPLLLARDRWLKPGGKMLPRQVTTWIAPVWDRFIAKDLKFWRSRPYDVDLTIMGAGKVEEVLGYPDHLPRRHLLAEPQALWSVDVETQATTDVHRPFRGALSFRAARRGRLSALCGWFEAAFGNDIVLCSAPDREATHWGVVIFPLSHTFAVTDGAPIDVEVACVPREPGGSDAAWSVRINEGAWEHHRMVRAERRS